MNHKNYFCGMKREEFYMQRCIELAQKGVGSARPNPSVGCVIVFEDKVIGEGYTSAYGGSHAEVNAIGSVEEKQLLEKSTMYVTLEPCAHFGKTPPCSDAIIAHKISKVVIGCLDTNSLVSGKGIARLKNAGIEVVLGVLEQACKEQHKRFFTVQNKKRPYIILKWAETKDGFIAPEAKDKNQPVWISNEVSQQLVHKWRSEEQAILVGTNTAIADNPRLDVRSWTGNNPVRLLLDRTLRTPLDACLLDGSVQTLVFTEGKEENFLARKNVTYREMDFSKNRTHQICEILFQENIQSVLVEGGREVLQSFIDAGLWDEARVFTGDIDFTKGVLAPTLQETKATEFRVKNTLLKCYKNSNSVW
jgi:diaminohydroxyphosphoribosylaminopyrimidine deaminase/5-amino-6-(5-phosphoribosylamino)uracil reductase